MPTQKKTTRKGHKALRPKRKAGTGRKSAAKPNRRPQAPRRLRQAKTAGDNTFVYECTRAECGYKIWRDEKAETGELRFDLKCPKCHNHTFKCLGKEAVPETFNPTERSLDLDNIQPEALGSNPLP